MDNGATKIKIGDIVIVPHHLNTGKVVALMPAINPENVCCAVILTGGDARKSINSCYLEELTPYNLAALEALILKDAEEKVRKIRLEVMDKLYPSPLKA